MPLTHTERAISQRRNAQGVLRPLIEEFMRNSVEVESQEDVEWLAQLFRSGLRREEERKRTPVFSPSSFASCLRQVYLKRNYKEVGLVPLQVPRLEPQGYYLHGDFLHFKWQFVLYKMAQTAADFELVAVERRVASKRRDHAGTVDAVAIIEDEPYIVDFKGINVRDFQNVVNGRIPHHYRLQLSDYMVLANSDENFKKATDIDRIEKAILIAENKGGPDPKHPLAIHEHIVHLDEGIQEVRIRLKELRGHEEANTIPPPECEKTTSLQFKGCPFQRFCKREVKLIESRNSDGPMGEAPKARRPDSSRRSRRRK
jgi:hypothetical protein